MSRFHAGNSCRRRAATPSIDVSARGAQPGASITTAASTFPLRAALRALYCRRYRRSKVCAARRAARELLTRCARDSRRSWLASLASARTRHSVSDGLGWRVRRRERRSTRDCFPKDSQRSCRPCFHERIGTGLGVGGRCSFVEIARPSCHTPATFEVVPAVGANLHVTTAHGYQTLRVVGDYGGSCVSTAWRVRFGRPREDLPAAVPV